MSVSTRLAVIFGFLTFVFAWVIIRHFLAWRANRKIIASLLESDRLTSIVESESHDEVGLIRERYESAMRALEEASESDGRRSTLLSEIPWYIIIGPPGAGKTTILKNAGLEFPLKSKFGDDPIAGVGGTRNCDWWITDQAVLIDTAGRYTTQDVNAGSDRTAWLGFLDILKTQRSRRPINGVILAISISDILQKNDEQLRLQVTMLRQRIQELVKVFSIQVPVYVVFTKCDLIAGFSEFFDHFDRNARQQQWGITLPVDFSFEQFVSFFNREFDALARSLEDTLMDPIHKEGDIGRRCSMFVFPKEFANIKEIMRTFVNDLFRPSKFEQPAQLRGIYFTSGTQEGTPIERLIGAIGRNFGLQESVGRAFRGVGKAYFIHDTLTQVIFPEAGLVGTNRRLERQLAILHSLGYVAAFAILASCLTLWYGAYTRSESRIEETKIAAQNTLSLALKTRTSSTFTEILPLLNDARNLPTVVGGSSFFAWLDGMGISSTLELSPRASQAYDRILLAYLLPALADRLAVRLQSNLNSFRIDPSILKESLRVYLMLGDSGHFERSVVAQAARGQLPLAFPLDPQRTNAMAQHIDRLMELLPYPVALNRQLVSSVRASLTRLPPVEQVYSAFLREAASNPRLHSINLAEVLGATSLQVLGSRDPSVNRTVIPGAFTRQGFYEFALPRLPTIVQDSLNSDWVLADDSGSGASGVQKITRDVTNRYIADYVAAWTAGINAVTSIQFTDLQRGIVVLQSLADPQSPLQRFIDVVKDNVDLPPPGEESTKANDSPTPASVSAVSTVTSIAGKAATSAITSSLGDVPWPGKTIGTPFQPLFAFTAVGSGGQPTLASKVRDDLAKLFTSMSGLMTAPDPNQAAFQIVQGRVKDPANDVFSSLRSSAVQAPPPIKNILRDVSNESWAILLQMSYDYSNSAWKRDILPQCVGALDQRYPMFINAKDDVLLRDFSDFFRPDGIIDSFFKKYLFPLVVDQRTGYGVAKIDGVALPIRQDALEQFNRARMIKNAFFAGTGSGPSVKFSVKPVFLSPEMLRASLRIDAQEVVYRHEPPRSTDMDWPTKSDSSSVSVTLTALDGTNQKFEATGAWALFRIFDTAQISTAGTQDRFTFSIATRQGFNVTYELRAGSSLNPFNLAALRGFRCPDSL